MQSAEAAWSAPTYGTSGHLQHAPGGVRPRRTARAGSAGRPRRRPSVAATSPDAAGTGSCGRSGRRIGSRCRGSAARIRRPRAQRPSRPISTVDDLVPLRVEGVDHRPGGGERDRVLRRAAAHQHRDPAAGHHGTRGRVAAAVVDRRRAPSPEVVAVVGRGASSCRRSSPAAVYRPTVIVTVVPGVRRLARRPASGEDDAVQRRVRRVDDVDDHLEAGVPQRRDRVRRARSWSRPGRPTRSGPWRRTASPSSRSPARLFAGGSCWTTVPFGSFESTSRRATAKPGALERRRPPTRTATPTTGGTPIGFGPCETLIRTFVALDQTRAPGLRDPGR